MRYTASSFRNAPLGKFVGNVEGQTGEIGLQGQQKTPVTSVAGASDGYFSIRYATLSVPEEVTLFRAAGFLASGPGPNSSPSHPNRTMAREVSFPVTVAGPHRLLTGFPFICLAANTTRNMSKWDSTAHMVESKGRGKSGNSKSTIRHSFIP